MVRIRSILASFLISGLLALVTIASALASPSKPPFPN